MSKTIYITPVQRKTPYNGYKYSHTRYSFWVDGEKLVEGESYRFGNVTKFKKFLVENRGIDLSDVEVVRLKAECWNFI
jgi:hypothetical protein